MSGGGFVLSNDNFVFLKKVGNSGFEAENGFFRVNIWASGLQKEDEKAGGKTEAPGMVTKTLQPPPLSAMLRKEPRLFNCCLLRCSVTWILVPALPVHLPVHPSSEWLGQVVESLCNLLFLAMGVYHLAKGKRDADRLGTAAHFHATATFIVPALVPYIFPAQDCSGCADAGLGRWCWRRSWG